MLDPDRVRALVRAALDEDLGRGDLTTEVTVPDRARAGGDLVAKQELIVAGMEVARTVFQALDPALEWAPDPEKLKMLFKGIKISGGGLL